MHMQSVSYATRCVCVASLQTTHMAGTLPGPGTTTMVKIAFDEKLCFADQAAGWKKSEFCSGPVHHRLYLYDVMQRR